MLLRDGVMSCWESNSASSTQNGAPVGAVVEIVADACDSTPISVQQNEDEHFLIVEGTAVSRTAIKHLTPQPAQASPMPYVWRNRSECPLSMLEIPSPGGCEEALRIIAKRGDVDFSALSEKFCIRVVGPMLIEGSNPTIPPPRA